MRVLVQDRDGYTLFSYETDLSRKEQNVHPGLKDARDCQVALMRAVEALNMDIRFAVEAD
jgi:hypothetical protein